MMETLSCTRMRIQGFSSRAKSYIQKFRWSAILLIDDLRIIGGTVAPPRDILGRLGTMRKALFNPDSLLTMFKPGWGKSVELLTVQRLALDVPNVSFCLLDGPLCQDSCPVS